MKKICSIVESPYEPQGESLWLNNGTLSYLSAKGWTVITSPVSWTDVENKPATFTPVTATTSIIGGVKQATAVANVAVGADTVALVTTVNNLLSVLRTAGILSN